MLLSICNCGAWLVQTMGAWLRVTFDQSVCLSDRIHGHSGNPSSISMSSTCFHGFLPMSSLVLTVLCPRPVSMVSFLCCRWFSCTVPCIPDALGKEYIWERFSYRIAPIAKLVPYHVTVGNHGEFMVLDLHAPV